MDYDIGHNQAITIKEQADTLGLAAELLSENINLTSNFMVGPDRRSDGQNNTRPKTEIKQMEEAVHFLTSLSPH